MPSWVEAHPSHSVKGRSFEVQGHYMNARHTQAFDDRAEAIEESLRRTGRKGNPYAIAAAEFQREGKPIFTKRSYQHRIGLALRAMKREGR